MAQTTVPAFWGLKEDLQFENLSYILSQKWGGMEAQG